MKILLAVPGDGGSGGVGDANVAVGVVLFGGDGPLLHKLEEGEEGDDDLDALLRAL